MECYYIFKSYIDYLQFIKSDLLEYPNSILEGLALFMSGETISSGLDDKSIEQRIRVYEIKPKIMNDWNDYVNALDKDMTVDEFIGTYESDFQSIIPDLPITNGEWYLGYEGGLIYTLSA